MPRRTIWSVLAAALLCLVMLPVTALAAGEDVPNVLYVGTTNIGTTSYNDNAAYWTSEDGGTTWNSQQTQPEGDSYIYYDGQGTLELHNVTIQGQYDDSKVFGAGIYALCGTNQSVSLTIQLTGNNTITGDFGIYVEAQQGGTLGANASLSITGDGSLTVTGTASYGLYVKSGTGDASLTIKNASVDAKTTQTYSSYAGVCVQSGASATGSPQLSLAVNGGSLTASGTGSRDGILFHVGSSQATGATTSLTVSENAIVDARNGGISATGVNITPKLNIGSTGSTGGIVWNGAEGTVYGNVTLQEDLTIESGQTLTIPDGASLTIPDDKTLTVNGGALTGDVTGTVIYKVTGVSLNKTELTLTEGDSVTLTASIAPTDATNQKVTWNSSAPAVATVDADGKVTAVDAGTAVITVTTEDGNKTATCTVTVEHDPASAWSSDEDGHWHACASCRDKLYYAAHTTEVVGEQDATCTGEGYTGDKVCSVCGHVIAKGETVPATGHSWGAWDVSKPATCTEDGLEIRTCAACGETQNRTAPASGHSFTSYASNHDATCTEDGTETAACDNGCGATDTRADEGSAFGHAWGEPAWSWSDDGSSATATFTCENDPEHVQRPEVTVSSEVLLAPTCTEAGTTRYVATVELGGRAHTSTKDVADIPATGHSFTSYVSNDDATCTEDGTETAACNNGCGATDTRVDEGSALSHELERVDEITATCTEPGTREHWKCARCGALFANEDGTKPVNADELAIPASGHSPAAAWSSDESGHWHACENGCGTRLDAAAHVPETTGEKDATCTDEGYTGDITCAACDHVIAEGETVPATGHSWCAWDATEPATCEKDGVETRACEACGEEETRSVPALGHGWGEPEWSWSEDGTSFVATFTCAHDVSHVTELMARPTLEVVSKPTCTEPGVTRYYAEIELDGVTYAAESTAANVPALGHDFENGTCTVCGAKDEGYVVPEEPKDPEQTPEPVEPEPEDSKPDVKPSDPEPTVPETGDTTASFSLALGILGAAALGAGALARRRG